MQATHTNMFAAIRILRKARITVSTKLDAQAEYVAVKPLSVHELQMIVGGVDDSPKGSWNASVVSAN